MKTLLFVSAVTAAMTVGPHTSLAQQAAVSEEEARCFVTGVCKIDAEKKFSLTNITTRPAKPSANATPVAPVAARARPTRRSPVRVAANTARFARSTPVARPSLDMRLNFDLGSARLTRDAAAQADLFAKVLTESGGQTRFLIAGHTDSIGSRASNSDLSRRRAQSVVDHLIARGVPATTLRAEGFGFDQPRAGRPASDPSNRRVEIVKL